MEARRFELGEGDAVTQRVSGKRRIAYIDIAKGFAMLCIIAGHFGVYAADRFVYTFHVPLFFLASGYFFSVKGTFGEFLRTRVRQLMVPYLVGSVGIMLFLFTAKLIAGIGMEGAVQSAFVDTPLGMLYGSGVPLHEPFEWPRIGLLWFLPALCFAQIYLRLALRTSAPALVIVAIALAGGISGQYLWLPMDIQSGAIGAFFLYLGMLARRYGILEKRPPILLVAGLLLLWAHCIGADVRINIVDASFGSGWQVPLCIVDALGASYLVVLGCKALERAARPLAAALNYCGQGTIAMMVFHAVADRAFPDELFYRVTGVCGTPLWLQDASLIAVNMLWAILGIVISQRFAPFGRLIGMREIRPYQPRVGESGSHTRSE